MAPADDVPSAGAGTISRTVRGGEAFVIDVPALGGDCWADRGAVAASGRTPRVGQPVDVVWERPGPPGYAARALRVTLREDLTGTPGA